jgi:predicted porin
MFQFIQLGQEILRNHHNRNVNVVDFVHHQNDYPYQPKAISRILGGFMKKTLLATVSVLGAAAVMLPGLARADSVSDLQVQMQIIEGQIKTLQAHSRSLTPSGRTQLEEVQTEVSQMKVQLDEIKAQPPANSVGAYPYPGLPPAAPGTGVAFNGGTGPVGPKVIKPLVGGILLYQGNGSAFFIDGTLDGGIRDDFGAGHSTLAVQSGAARASRLALEGYQNIGQYLGVNLRAVGVLEAGFNINTGYGSSNAPGVATGAFTFGRESYAGIGNDEIGYIDFGRQYSPLWATVASPTADPFGGNFLGGIVAIDPTLALNSRVSNAIIYNYNYTWEGMIDPAPSHGLGFAAMYAPGQQHSGTKTNPVANGQQLGAMVSYGTKLFFVDAGYNQIDGYNSTDTAYTASYLATYPSDKTALKEFSTAGSLLTPLGRVFAQIGVQYNGRNKAKPDAIDQDYWFVGFAAPTFKHQLLRFSYGTFYNHDQTYKGTTKQAQYSVAQASYEYDLVQVPGTALYVDGLIIDNNKYSAQGILGGADVSGPYPTLVTDDGATEYGATAETLAMGIRYIF